jgi:hypothetical protein
VTEVESKVETALDGTYTTATATLSWLGDTLQDFVPPFAAETEMAAERGRNKVTLFTTKGSSASCETRLPDWMPDTSTSSCASSFGEQSVESWCSPELPPEGSDTESLDHIAMRDFKIERIRRSIRGLDIMEKDRPSFQGRMSAQCIEAWPPPECDSAFGGSGESCRAYASQASPETGGTSNDANEVTDQSASALLAVAKEIEKTEKGTQSAPLDLNLLLLSGETLLSLRAEQSWTGLQLKEAALEQMQPTTIPRSLICSKGVIHESETLEKLSLIPGDSLQILVGSLVGRYCGTAEASCVLDQLDEEFEAKYELNILENGRFDLTGSMYSTRTATLCGKLTLGSRFVFDTSQPEVRLWLDDAGLIRLSDTGHWDFYDWDTVMYDGVEALRMMPVSCLKPDAFCR